MAVVCTYVKDNKTIRIWHESRGKKTLIRKFYLRYMLSMINRGHLETKVFDTFSKAKQYSKEWMDKNAKDWRRYNEFCTHIDGSQWRSIDKGVSARCYITEEGGDLISEVIE